MRIVADYYVNTAVVTARGGMYVYFNAHKLSREKALRHLKGAKLIENSFPIRKPADKKELQSISS